MRGTTGRAVLAVALSAAALSASAQGTPASAPDLAVAPPKDDKILVLLQNDPDLYAQAASGTNRMEGGKALTFLGGIAIAVGFFWSVADMWAAGVDSQPGQAKPMSSGGLLVLAGGAAAIGGGFAPRARRGEPAGRGAERIQRAARRRTARLLKARRARPIASGRRPHPPSCLTDISR